LTRNRDENDGVLPHWTASDAIEPLSSCAIGRALAAERPPAGKTGPQGPRIDVWRRGGPPPKHPRESEEFQKLTPIQIVSIVRLPASSNNDERHPTKIVG